MQYKQGTQAAPLIITTDTDASIAGVPGADGTMTIASLVGINLYQCSYIYFVNVAVIDQYSPIMIQQSTYILVRRRYDQNL